MGGKVRRKNDEEEVVTGHPYHNHQPGKTKGWRQAGSIKNRVLEISRERPSSHRGEGTGRRGLTSGGKGREWRRRQSQDVTFRK